MITVTYVVVEIIANNVNSIAIKALNTTNKKLVTSKNSIRVNSNRWHVLGISKTN